MSFVVKLDKIPEQTIANGITILCRNGSKEYRNIVKGQQEYEIPDSVEPVRAFVNTEKELEIKNE